MDLTTELEMGDENGAFSRSTPQRLEVAARIERDETVTAPSNPPDFPNLDSLITTDCNRPAESP